MLATMETDRPVSLMEGEVKPLSATPELSAIGGEIDGRESRHRERRRMTLPTANVRAAEPNLPAAQHWKASLSVRNDLGRAAGIAAIQAFG